MPDKITYYAVVGEDRTIDNPYGLVRRLEFNGDGFTDEGFRKDFSWAFTPAIVEWKHGGSFSTFASAGGRTGSRPTSELSPSHQPCARKP